MYESCYLAGGWFNEDQTRLLEKIYNDISNNFEVYCAYKETKDKESQSSNKMSSIFLKNLQEIERCTFFVGILDSIEDSGTIFEIGYAFKLNKKIYLFYQHDVDYEWKAKINLMLLGSSIVNVNHDKAKENKDIKAFVTSIIKHRYKEPHIENVNSVPSYNPTKFFNEANVLDRLSNNLNDDRIEIE